MNNNTKIEVLSKYTLSSSKDVEIIQSVNDVRSVLPTWWLELINLDECYRKDFVLKHWKQLIGNQLRNTISYLDDHLKEIDIVRINKSYYLLYSIKKSDCDDILYYCGGNTLTSDEISEGSLSSSWMKVPRDLKLFYEQLHNGFYYYPSRSMGIDAYSNVECLDQYEWGIIEDEQLELQFSLSSTYNFFSNGVGSYIVLDLDNPHIGSILWSKNCPPTYHLNFWDVIDEWIVLGFE